MRVLVDLRCAHRGLTGIGRYAVNLCLSLERLPSPVRVEAITGDAGAEYLRGQISCPLHVVRSRSPGEDDLHLPDLISSVRADLFHSPLFILPSVQVARYIATLHDVIPLVRPDLTTPSFHDLFKRTIPEALRRASHIVTVSEHSRKDCLRTLKLPPGRITAVPEPVHPMFGPKPLPESEKALGAWGLRPGFIFYVGAIDRRKNIARLIQAYGILRRESGNVPPLVLAGAPNDDGFDLPKEVGSAALEKHVRILGRVPDELLVHLYSGAGLVVFPSLYEGFGLPVVEAMASGTPVVASRTSSIPEVAGEAALLVDPEDPAEIAKAISRVLENSQLREDLRKKGLARAKIFTLERQAEALFDLYGRLLREAA